MTRTDLMAAAEAAYADGDLEGALAHLERAYEEALAGGDRLAAGAAAARLAMHLLIDTGLLAPVRGWIKRSESTLEDQDDTPVHAWIELARSCERMLSGAFPDASAHARKAIELGTRHDVASVVAFARGVEARCLIFTGDVDKGLQLLEDVADSLFTGEIDALTAGCLYCEVVCAWQSLARYDLAERWTDAMERFSRVRAVGSIGGRCRVHRAEILRLRGDLGEAERVALDACAQLRPYMRLEYGWPLTELGRIRFARGDHAGAEEAFTEAHAIGWDAQPGLALMQLAKGDAAGALRSIRDALDNPVSVPFKERPPNNELRRAPLLDACVQIAVAADDVDAARGPSEELSRVADHYGGPALHAAAALSRARVQAADGNDADAVTEARRAVALWTEVSAPYETAAARTVLAEAHRAAGDEAAAELEERSASAVLTGARRPEPNEFRREGDYWTLTFGGATVRLRDLKGLHYLSDLMRDPGHELHVVDLAGGCREPSDSAPLLDAQAKAMYRRRITEIEEDIEEARAFGDTARVASAEREREFVVRELSRAVGLGGRDRRAGAASERARAGVTRAIRHAMARIDAEHRPLGEHLERTVRTGTYCVYLPDPRVPADWVF
jgi:tetratricopeptide (TPR) repeat protein